MRGKPKEKYIGRYTVTEFHRAKFRMVNLFTGELSVHKVDKILKYCAEKDWPAERMETYKYASTQEPAVAQSLKYYDFAQDLLDAAHHGDRFMRVWPEYEDIPESKREPDLEKLRRLVSADTPGYTGGTVVGPASQYLEKLREE